MKKKIGIVLMVYALMCIMTYVYVMLDTENYINNNEFDPKFKRFLREDFIPRLSSEDLGIPEGITKYEADSFLITEPKLIKPAMDRWKHQLYINSKFRQANGANQNKESYIEITVMRNDNGDYSVVDQAKGASFRYFTRKYRHLFRFHWKDTFGGFEPRQKVKYEY